MMNRDFKENHPGRKYLPGWFFYVTPKEPVAYYQGTAAQNVKMLSMLKAGKLLR
ncbi:MAG: hypothetical protein SO172_02665 [Pararoseburia sp.]|nr:hypothetical protein [Pararoseburia sp.]